MCLSLLWLTPWNVFVKHKLNQFGMIRVHRRLWKQFFSFKEYTASTNWISSFQSSRMASSDSDKHVNGKTFAETDKLLSDAFEMSIKKAVQAGRNRDNPVIRFKTPEELKQCINFALPGHGIDHSELLDLFDKVLENSVLTGHARYCNQQIGGLDPYGLAAEIIASSLTTNGHTYEIGPVFSVAEVEVINHVKKFVGFNDGDGSFCPGGTYSNMLAMNLAKLKQFPNSKASGLSGVPKLATFCSEQAHYSAKKNASLLGFGEDYCFSVKCDNRGKMIPEELEKSIVAAKESGCFPLFATATAGTTVLGAFDPFNEIANICEKYNIWLHIDGAWGASALLSKKYKHLCDGVERANSLAWNFHKMISAPNQCALLLVKEAGLLKKAHSLVVPYLFQDGKPYDQSYDLGRNLVQCGRRVDAFKLWVMWKAKGDIGMEKHVDRALDNAEYLTEAIKKREHFRLVIPKPEFTNVPFWFVPPSMFGQKEDEDFNQKLSKIVPVIKLRMQKAGTLLVGFTPTPDIPAFFRMTVMNELVNHGDMDFVLDEIERQGQDL